MLMANAARFAGKALIGGSVDDVGRTLGRAFGFGSAGHDKDRIKKNTELFNRARAGDSAAAAELRYRTTPAGWATEVARKDAARKLAALESGGPVPTNYATGSALGDELKRTADAVRSELATGVQRIGAGATMAATQAIAPDGSRLDGAVNIPTDRRTLYTAAAVVLVAVIVAAALFNRARS